MVKAMEMTQTDTTTVTERGFVPPESERRARLDDLGDYLWEQRQRDFAQSFWAPRAGYGGYRS